MHVSHRLHQGTTLREEKAGIMQVDVSCFLKTQHLQRLAAWASQEAGISPLAALLGQKLASEAEASSIPLDSVFLCERCETMLQPGTNCTIRIVKVATKKRKRTEKSRRPCQNKVAYTCHFCSHQNQTWGTAKGQVHALLASQKVQNPKPNSCDSRSHSKDKCGKGIMISKELQHDARRQNPSNPETRSEPKSSTPEAKTTYQTDTVAESRCPVTPSIKLASKSSNKSNRPDKVGSNSAGDASGKMTGTGSRKQQRRRSMSLRKMVENEFKEKNVTNFAIPFHL